MPPEYCENGKNRKVNISSRIILEIYFSRAKQSDLIPSDPLHSTGPCFDKCKEWMEENLPEEYAKVFLNKTEV